MTTKEMKLFISLVDFMHDF